MRAAGRLAVASVILTLPLGTLAQDADPAAQRPYRVGLLYWSSRIPGQVAMREGLEAELGRINDAQREAGGRGIEALSRVAGDGEAGIEHQIAQMNALIDAGVDLLVVQPTDNAALAKPLLRANQRGIPVVAYDQYISGKGRLTSYLTSDNTQAGFLDGEYVASLFPDAQRLKLVLVEYPHVSSTVERLNGFLAALDEREQPYQILKTYEAVEPASGTAAGQQILSDFPQPGSVDVVFTVNDGGGLNVVEELAAAGRSEVVVATVDGDARSVENIKAGRLTRIDCAQHCGALGRETMKVAWQVLQGRPVPRQVLIPVFPITRETQARWQGWNQPPVKELEKPWPSSTPVWRWAPKRSE